MDKRIIPVLLLKDGGLCKGTKFQSHKYVGDPMNAIKIFNEKEADEIFLLDISATRSSQPLDITMIEQVAQECYMPFGVGGGLQTTEQIRLVLNAGAEKVSLNSAALANPALITHASKLFGTQSIVVSIDYMKDLWGRDRVFSNNGRKNTGRDPLEWAQEAARLGAGELLINSIMRDGTLAGCDIPLIKKIVDAVDIPVIACGGVGSVADLTAVLRTGAAAAAGAMFVFMGPHRSVLINYPSAQEIAAALAQ